jgi:hypothetical protein
LPRSASNPSYNQSRCAFFEGADFFVPRTFAVDCNFSVAELSLLPGKSGTKAVLAFFAQRRVFFCLFRALSREGAPSFCSEEIMRDE